MSPHSSHICCHIFNVAHLQWRGLVVKLGMASSAVAGHHAPLNAASCTSCHIPCTGLMQKMCGPKSYYEETRKQIQGSDVLQIDWPKGFKEIKSSEYSLY